jgi:hypothetical protein
VHINSFLADQKILVAAAVLGVIEALRMHLILEYIDNNEPSDLVIVSDTAYAFYNKILEWLVDKTIPSAIQMKQDAKRK